MAKVAWNLEMGQRVGLFGHFGDFNFGNESTLQAMLYHLRSRHPGAELTCICSDPATVTRVYGVEAVSLNGIGAKALWLRRTFVLKFLRLIVVAIPCELYRWLEAFRVLRRIDSLIVPGTGLLTDVCGLRNWGPYNLFKWSIAAKMCDCKLMFVGVGAGPIYSRLGKWLVKSSLAVADFRSYRDRATKEYLCGIGVPASNDKVHPDLAFSLPKSVMLSYSAQIKRRPVVGLGLMLYTGSHNLDRPGDAIAVGYLESLAVFVNWLLEHGYDVRLLIGDICDRPVIQQFRALLKDRAVIYDADRIVDEPIRSVENLLFQLSETDVVVATRFHNVLLALLLDKPVISLSFHQKCVSLMNDMGLADYCQDITKLCPSRLIECFVDLQGNAQYVKALIKRKTVEFRREVDGQFAFMFREARARGLENLTESVDRAREVSLKDAELREDSRLAPGTGCGGGREPTLRSDQTVTKDVRSGVRRPSSPREVM